MTKTRLERNIKAMQTEAEFAADLASIKLSRGKVGEALHYQERASYWARLAREHLVCLVNPGEA
jgi:hypothetical protein